MTSVQELFEVAKKAADAAAAIHLKYAGNHPGEGTFTTSAKGNRYDRVTTADTEAEKAITEIILTRWPDHHILAEEGSYPPGNSPYRWIIDPLDGTNNYSKGLPDYCVSIAAARDNLLQTAVILAPARGETYTACRGEGASLNGAPLRVSGVDDLRDAMVGTGFYYDRDRGMKRTLEIIEALFRREIVGIRRHGSAALDFCQVAAGRFDAFFELKNQPWDYAAGALIVEEAGGRVTDERGKPLTLEASAVAATNGLLHGEILSLMA